jgi:hypothetical protein
MPLTDRQISEFARVIDSKMSLPGLVQLADEIGVDLNNLAPDGSVKTRAEAFLKAINSERRPRDRELLDLIVRKGDNEISPTIKNSAAELLKPSYFPPADPHAAALLGRTGFFGRDPLRQRVREFTNHSDYTTRVLIVRGAKPGGKTYSWEFLRHLATVAGAEPMRLRLKKSETHTPRELVERVAQLLGLDVSTIPKLADNPQNMRMGALRDWFQRQLVKLDRSYWLIIDDLNDEKILPEARLCAYMLAEVVEEKKPDKLWIALLGYNEPITNNDMRWRAEDDATFPTAAMLARHFVALAPEGMQLSFDEALGYANLLYPDTGELDSEAMSGRTSSAEKMAEKLRLGLRPP